MIGTLRETGPLMAEDWRQLALSKRDRLLPPLTKIPNQPKHTFARYFTGEHFGLDLSYLLCVRTNMFCRIYYV